VLLLDGWIIDWMPAYAGMTAERSDDWLDASLRWHDVPALA